MQNKGSGSFEFFWQNMDHIGGRNGYGAGGYAGIAGRNTLSKKEMDENFPTERTGMNNVPPPEPSFELRRRVKLRPEVSNR